MEIYRSNRNCGCMRCRCRGIMGGVILMTLGVMFLLDEFHVRDLNFDNTSPMILIAIGVVLMLQRTASIEGHVQPYAIPPAGPVPVVAPYAVSTPDTPPVAPSSEVRHE